MIFRSVSDTCFAEQQFWNVVDERSGAFMKCFCFFCKKFYVASKERVENLEVCVWGVCKETGMCKRREEKKKQEYKIWDGVTEWSGGDIAREREHACEPWERDVEGRDRERERGGDCCKQGFAAMWTERKGAVALSSRVLYTLTCARTCTHTLFPLCLSPNVSVNQSVDYLCLCVCSVGTLTRARNHPSSLWPTVRSFQSLCLFDRLSHRAFVSACFHSTFFSHVCVFAVTLVRSQTEASMEPCHCLLSFTIHFEPQGVKVMSSEAEALFKGGLF